MAVGIGGQKGLTKARSEPETPGQGPLWSSTDGEEMAKRWLRCCRDYWAVAGSPVCGKDAGREDKRLPDVASGLGGRCRYFRSDLQEMV